MFEQLVGGVNFDATTEQDSQITIAPYRAIGDLIANATFEEMHTDILEITDQPIDQGAQVADHAFKRAAELTIKLGFSNSSPGDGTTVSETGEIIQSTLSGSSVLQIKDVYQLLLKMQEDREFLEVFTGKRKYENMLIRQIMVLTDVQTENMLGVTVDFKQVLRVAPHLLQTSAPLEDQAEPEVTTTPVDYGTKQLESEVPTFDAVAAVAAIDPQSLLSSAPISIDSLSTQVQAAFDQLDGMVPFKIPTNGLPQQFDVTLSTITNKMKMNWNPQAGTFILDILDKNQVPILSGLSLVTGSDLLSQFEYLGFSGSLLVQTSGAPDVLPTAENFGTLSNLYYLAKA